MTKKRIYLDYNATTPPAEFLHQAIPKWLKIWGNPSSVHQTGQNARALFWKGKLQMAGFINCSPLELIAASGGSEANNTAIKGLYHKYFPHGGLPSPHSGRSTPGQLAPSNKNHKTDIIISAVEHPSVKGPVEHLQSLGMRVHTVPVSAAGKLDLAFYESVLSDKTFLVCIMYANNETGHIFPIEKLSHKARAHGAFFHCDMVQALGKIPLSLNNMCIDTAAFSAHKFHALKGTGLLYARKGISPESLIHGGPQERRRRAGTENTLGMACLGAVALKGKEILKKFQSLKTLRDEMESDLIHSLPEAKIIGPQSKRLHNTSAILIPNIPAETVLMNMDLKGYSFSVGSACHSGSLNPSETLLAMGFSESQARSAFRLSLGPGIQKKDLKQFVKDLQSSVKRIKKFIKS